MEVNSLSLRELLAKQFPPQNFVINQGLLPKGGMLLIGGPPKSYKSFVMNTIAYHLITGTHVFNAARTHAGVTSLCFEVPKPQRVLLFEQEVGEYGMQRRLAPMLATASPEHKEAILDNLIIHSRDAQLALDTKEGVRRMNMLIQRAKPDVCMFDPMVEFHRSDENSTKDMSTVLHNLELLRSAHGFTTVMSHHQGKPDLHNSRSGPDLLRGNSVIFGKGDSYMMLKPVNRNAGLVQVDFTIRQDRPISTLQIILDWNLLRARFHAWGAFGAKKGAKTVQDLDDELGPLM